MATEQLVTGSKLDGLESRIVQIFENSSYIDVDFMLRSQIEDFLECLKEASTCDPTDPTFVEYMTQLSTLANIIRLNVGDLGRIPTDLREVVQEMFEYAGTMEGVAGNDELAETSGYIRADVELLLNREAVPCEV